MIDIDKEFDAWWAEHGQYHRAGGGEYEMTFAYHAYVAAAKRHAAQVAEPGPSGASVDSVARDAALGAAIQRAAGELPPGWQIEITVEQGAGSAMLQSPQGDWWNLTDPSDRPSNIDPRVEAAIAAMSPTKAGETEP